MAKLSEELANVKQFESELLRKLNFRNDLIKATSRLKDWEREKKTAKEIEKIEADFTKEKIKKVELLSCDIEKLRTKLIQLKGKINKKNVEMGIDKDILEVKWLRIELAQLMKLAKKEDYSFISKPIEEMENSGLFDIIKDLESKKKKIDSKIQNQNFRTEI